MLLRPALKSSRPERSRLGETPRRVRKVVWCSSIESMMLLRFGRSITKSVFMSLVWAIKIIKIRIKIVTLWVEMGSMRDGKPNRADEQNFVDFFVLPK